MAAALQVKISGNSTSLELRLIFGTARVTHMLTGMHHVAIICSDYRRSKQFYSEILGLRIVAENYRAERDSFKLYLLLPDGTIFLS